ncbi:MAG: MoaD/ThiS family protein [Ktedonobacteraceae bacterium]|nr:MoaD/ThiS family protein [Ktedonobacteraceae bacterium]
MMQVHVTLYGALRVVAGRQLIHLTFEAPAITMQQLLDALVTTYPSIRTYLLDSSFQTLHPNARVQINGQRVPHSSADQQILQDNDRITFLVPHSGEKAG